ncbi:MAG: hypothetical protein F4W93_05260 [Dehalococcoidia bacterium]|nr:hypothetical protein [Dehalococcoidia bacterium]
MGESIASTDCSIAVTPEVLPSLSGLTSMGVLASRAGRMKALAIPFTTRAMYRCQSASVSVK